MPISTGEKVCSCNQPLVCMPEFQATACTCVPQMLSPTLSSCTLAPASVHAQHLAGQECPTGLPRPAGHNLEHMHAAPPAGAHAQHAAGQGRQSYINLYLPLQVFTPSGKMLDYGTPRALEASEIPRIVKQFADGARNSLAAGALPCPDCASRHACSRQRARDLPALQGVHMLAMNSVAGMSMVSGLRSHLVRRPHSMHSRVVQVMHETDRGVKWFPLLTSHDTSVP